LQRAVEKSREVCERLSANLERAFVAALPGTERRASFSCWLSVVAGQVSRVVAACFRNCFGRGRAGKYFLFPPSCARHEFESGWAADDPELRAHEVIAALKRGHTKAFICSTTLDHALAQIELYTGDAEVPEARQRTMAGSAQIPAAAPANSQSRSHALAGTHRAGLLPLRVTEEARTAFAYR